MSPAPALTIRIPCAPPDTVAARRSTFPLPSVLRMRTPSALSPVAVTDPVALIDILPSPSLSAWIPSARPVTLAALRTIAPLPRLSRRMPTAPEALRLAETSSVALTMTSPSPSVSARMPCVPPAICVAVTVTSPPKPPWDAWIPIPAIVAVTASLAVICSVPDPFSIALMPLRPRTAPLVVTSVPPDDTLLA